MAPHRCAFPLVWRTSMNYAYSAVLTTTVTSNVFPAPSTWQLNSLFAPVASDAHQPNGFDQTTALYKRYRVDRVRVRLVLAPFTSTYPAVVAWQIVGPGASDQINGKTVDVATEANDVATVWLDGTTSRPTTVQFDLDFASFLGLTRAAYKADDLYQAFTSASPSNLVYLVLSASNASASGAIQTINYQMNIEFTGEFTDRAILAPS